jgi:hypothetical protein
MMQASFDTSWIFGDRLFGGLKIVDVMEIYSISQSFGSLLMFLIYSCFVFLDNNHG